MCIFSNEISKYIPFSQIILVMLCMHAHHTHDDPHELNIYKFQDERLFILLHFTPKCINYLELSYVVKFAYTFKFENS